MTRAQADRLIKTAKPIKVANDHGGFTEFVLIRRERSTIYTACGAAFHRDDIEEATGA